MAGDGGRLAFQKGFLEDAISNVTIGVGPGGGVSRQRRTCRISSLLPVLKPRPSGTSLRLKGGYLFTHQTIDQAADPSLAGKLSAQTPENISPGGIEWTPAAKWLVSAQVRYTDQQFEDDQNSRVLAPFTTVRHGGDVPLASRLRGSPRRNLFNTGARPGNELTD